MLFFIFGLFLGSFLNNLALRLEKNEDFLFSRSKCPFCGKILTWKELIPILSFLFQKGKCKGCSAKISLRYPLVEILTGLWVFLLAFSLKTVFTPFSILEFIFYLIFLSLLFVLALYDLKTFLIDDRLIFFGVLIGALFNLTKVFLNIFPRDFSYLFNYFFNFNKFEPIVTPFLLSSIFLLIFLITKGNGIGFGDVKVAFLIGLFLRPGDALLSIILSSFFGSIYGLFLILKEKNWRRPIPFVPFMFLGVLIAIVFGQRLTEFYFKFML